MLSWLRHVDELLRGRKTTPALLAEGRIDLPLGMYVPMVLIFGAAYGFFMGWYAVVSREPASYMQLIASTVKLPALFLLTLVVTFPSLYVFNALVGCRLSFGATLRLLVGAIVVNVTVAASLGTILGFFTFSTESYSFMILLNVVLLAIAGFVALAFLLHTLRRLASSPHADPLPASRQGCDEGDKADGSKPSSRELGPLEETPGSLPDEALGQARTIFRIWIVIYGLVGAQMGWLLRPFIGSPDLPFTWFRHRQGNFFESIFQHLQTLGGG
ncbi:MAG: hypothetical protein JXQ75_02595 [Phycisphaerae bacterium]|nr:hypothetical protein [Phycisphaerae bacterium]